MRKSRWWCFEIYQENFTPDVFKALEDTHLEIVYALHDKDVTEKGEPKKPHYHVMVKYGNTTTDNCIHGLFDAYAANKVVFPVTSPRGMFRYFRHLDNPEKYQYDDDVYTFLNGFDVADVVSDTDIENMLQEIDHMIIDNHIVYYHDLVNKMYDDGKLAYIKAIHKNVTHIKTMLQSVRMKTEDLKKKTIADNAEYNEKGLMVSKDAIGKKYYTSDDELEDKLCSMVDKTISNINDK